MKKEYSAPSIEVKHFARKDVADSNVIVSCSPASVCGFCGEILDVNHICAV